MDPNRRREAAQHQPEYRLDHHDRERALEHQLDRIAPSRRAAWPKDDRRSSERPGRPGQGADDDRSWRLM